MLNMMVFGAVATGNIKAQLALIAAGTMRISGSIPAANAAVARIGIIKVVVAVLLVISVKKVMVIQIVAIITTICQVEIPASAAPSCSLKPDVTNAFAIAMPPPNRINIPQGILFAVSQSRSFSPLPFGIKNIAITAINATLASLAEGSASAPLQPPKGWLRVTQASAVKEKTIKTRFSSTLQD